MTDLIQEAIEAAATQDLCGNHNSADLLRRLVGELDAERAGADDAVQCLRYLRAMVWGECPSLLIEDSGGDAALDLRIDGVISARAKRMEAGE